MRKVANFAAVIIAFAFTVLASGQQSQFMQPTKDNHGFDSVDVGTLDTHFNIPIFSKPGRAGFNFNFYMSYDSLMWTKSPGYGQNYWVMALGEGWQPSWTLPVGGYISEETYNATCFNPDYGTYDYIQVTDNISFIDQYGNTHYFPGYISDGCDSGYYGGPDPSYPPFSSGDGYTLISYNTVVFPNGTTSTLPFSGSTGPSPITDPYGNEIILNAGVFTDTTGSAVLTVGGAGSAESPLTFTYPTAPQPSGPSTATVIVSYVTYTVQTNFGCSGIGEFGPLTSDLIDRVTYPDGSYYQFTYEPTPGISGAVTGRIQQVKLPTGGRIKYTNSGGNNGINCQTYTVPTLTRALLDDPAGSTYTYTASTTFTPYGSSAWNVSSTTNVVDGDQNKTVYNFNWSFASQQGSFYLPPTTPVEASRTVYPPSSTQPYYSRTVSTQAAQPNATPPVPASQSYTETFNGNATKKTAYTFDDAGWATETDVYDFATGSSPGPLLQKTLTAYSAWEQPASVNVYAVSNGNSNLISSTSYAYNEYTPSPAPSGTANFQPSLGSGALNLTTVTVSQPGNSSGSGTSYSRHMHYDATGQMVTSTDFNNNPTSYFYDTNTDTFLKTIGYPLTNGNRLSTQTQFDLPSGTLTKSWDANSNLTQYKYNRMGQLLEQDAPDGGVTKYTYSPASSSTGAAITQSVLQQSPNVWGAAVTTTYDPYGRTSTVQQAGVSSTPATYSYDGNGNLSQAYNPTSNNNDEISGRAYYRYDALNRLQLRGASDDAISVGDDSAVTWIWSGNSMFYTDENNNETQYTYDGLGRLSSVMEPDGYQTPAYLTQYLYNQNFSPLTYTSQTVVQQHGNSTNAVDWRQRTFTYDIFGRLVSETTPEAGTTSMNYGSCSGDYTQLCSRTDANGNSTTYGYDGLNRLSSKSYTTALPTVATASVSYVYDQGTYNGVSVANPLGQRVGMSDGSGATTWSYDVVGRTVGVTKQITTGAGSVTRTSTYNYNPDGTLHQFQDFGGTTFTYGYDSASRPTSLNDNAGRTYVSSAGYNALSAMTSMSQQLNSSGATFNSTWDYNPRLQMTGVQVTASTSTNPIMKHTFGYLPGNDTGFLSSQTNDLDASRSFYYNPDSMNRIYNVFNRWFNQTYNIDPWGNLNSVSGNTNAWSSSAGTWQRQNQLSQLNYDANGEVTLDTSTSTAYQYNAEGRIVATGQAGLMSNSLYDGDGYRVAKTTPGGTTTLYWPSPVLGIIDESNAAGTSFGKQVYFAGLQVWSEDTAGTGKFLFSDHLGSTRLTADANGNVLDDIDYLPYGQVLHNYGTAASDNHYTFTGYEQEDASGTNLYGTFRNLQTNFGRYTRPDPYDGSYNLSDPQSLNRYAYVGNRPLSFVDPVGLFWYIETCYIYSTIGLDSYFDDNGVYHTGVESLQTTCNIDAWGDDGGGGGFDGAPEGGGGGNQPCGIVVKCRGIQKMNLGVAGFQHCDAQVTDSSGAVHSDSAGPMDLFPGEQVLNAWDTSPPTEPFTGNTIYQGNSCSVAGCVIQATRQWNKGPLWPPYNPVLGPNSNTFLKNTFADCGVNLPINNLGPIW